MADALGLLGRSGVACLLGIDGRDQKVELDGHVIGVDTVLENRVLFGSVNAARQDWVAGVAALDRARVEFPGALEQLVALRVPLDRFAERSRSTAARRPSSSTMADVAIRAAVEGDRQALAELKAAVAEEGMWIGLEPPFDAARLAEDWEIDGTLVAVSETSVVAEVRVEPTYFGFGELGMMVAHEWRGRGVGTALVEAAIDWSRERGLHKISLSVFPHNEAGVALYRKLGFVEEGRRIKHIRRKNGELWDLIDMGLLL